MTVTENNTPPPKKILQIYNLEFPAYIEELKIGDYLFKRIKDYEKAFNGMMHLVNSSGSEFNTKIQTGSHQITATVEIPLKEKESVLPWENKLTQLDDILLLLTIFTDRNVFKKDWEDNDNSCVISDHRVHHFGGQLSCSIKYEARWKHIDSGIIKNEDEMKNVSEFGYNLIDIGFEKTLNQLLQLISSKSWQDEYSQGYFLFLYRDALPRQILERSFLTCWTIWEQIFSIKHRKWLPDDDIFKMGADKKIAYILTTYFSKNIDKTGWNNIRRITKSRNRLVHFGKKMDNVTNKEKELLVRLTEQLIAYILNLQPSNIFNSFEKLEEFLSQKK